MNVILFDDPTCRINLLPLTFTRPIGAIRVGILTIADKWKRRLNAEISFATADYLSGKFPATYTDDNLWINAGVCPNPSFVELVTRLKQGEGIRRNTTLVAARSPERELPEVITGKVFSFEGDLTVIDRPWKIFLHNGSELQNDFTLITAGRKSASIQDAATVVYRPENVFVEDGVVIRAGILNATNGPIYLGKDSQVQEGAIVRGPFSLGERSIINMGGKMRGDTTIGPDCKVGGEISNSVIFGSTNKSHDGFIGNSVLGEWCNIGADTNTSNLKNNYDTIRVWSYTEKRFVSTGLTFCGLVMGDHSKSGINTMFNSGTLAGVSANIFGAGYQRQLIPSFSWGTRKTYQLDAALEAARKSMARREMKMTLEDEEILKNVFALSQGERPGSSSRKK